MPRKSEKKRGPRLVYMLVHAEKTWIDRYIYTSRKDALAHKDKDYSILETYERVDSKSDSKVDPYEGMHQVCWDAITAFKQRGKSWTVIEHDTARTHRGLTKAAAIKLGTRLAAERREADG